jgi:hypothetical protein
MVPRAFAISCARLFSCARFIVVLVVVVFGYLHFQARRDLLMREFGSLAVLELVSFERIPFILAQKEALRPASFLVFGFGAGGFRLPPCALLYDALPLALSPPLGFLPSLRVHASVIVISF